MKWFNFGLFFIISLVFLGCKESHKGNVSADVIVIPATASGKSETDKYPIITFEKTEHDFGKVIRGEKVTYRFKFKNTGKIPLIISDVASSCGCTVPEYSKIPIPPNEEGLVTVTFNSQSLSGFKKKSVTVLTNAQPPSVVLWLFATVETPTIN